MTTWALIPCSKKKAVVPCPAWEMYRPSAMFQGAWRVAEHRSQQALILSARHGMLWPGTVIEPYDQTLAGAPVMARERWTADVLQQLDRVLGQGDTVVSYLGRDYGEFLLPALAREGIAVVEPLKGMGQGKRLAWFKQQLSGEAA